MQITEHCPVPHAESKQNHLLIAALEFDEAGHFALVTSVSNIMASTSKQAAMEDDTVDLLWRHLVPFFITGLLHGLEMQGSGALEYPSRFSILLHSDLVSLACGVPLWRIRVLELLLR